ncbi:uncharacterized protein LOC116614180 isoform X2 [Nematostella vectensis]|uniref:uncharacterized protein LOC116614180 isoform X2 n=2 Tax=Nematostella vectensis TaxID=45351 RepID=UPI00207782AC|nr:uncharacterized protein LOC116614180 isoform X2 [Nematostella vectensis]
MAQDEALPRSRVLRSTSARNMKSVTFVLFVLSAHLSAQQRSEDLYCYSCASARSMKHCVLKQEPILCPAGKDRCLEAEFRGRNGYGFVRDCVKEEHCNEAALPQCTQLTGDNQFCSFSCCKGDHCNAGSRIAISGLIIGAWALVLTAAQFFA